jgi:hypothetical protein
MYQLSEILKFVEDQTGSAEGEVLENTDIEHDLPCTGDDFAYLIDKFSKNYNVDISGYRWYFHHAEEGSGGIGGAFFPAVNERVRRIPVTPKMLLKSANAGKWDIPYPDHKLPRRRYDLIINGIVIIIIFCILIYKWLF